MTREEELNRYYEERDVLEHDIELANRETIALELYERDPENDNPRWQELWDEINAAENEVSCLTNWINDLEDTDQ